MIQLNARQRLALRLCAVAMSLPVLAQVLGPRPACAAPVAAAPAAATAQASAGPRLFPDSKLVTRPHFSVEVVGQGPDVILIPGLASSRETYRRTAEQLRGRYRLHLVQIAGFAGEPARANASGPVMEPTLADLDGYITEARLNHPAVIGHSLGGVLGLQLAQQHPDHVGRLMIVDSLPFFGVALAGPDATPDQLRPMLKAMGERTLAMDDATFKAMQARTFSGTMVKAPEDAARVVDWSVQSDRRVMVTAMQEDMLADLRPGLAQVRLPVTVLYEPSLEPMVKTGYAALPNKTLTVVPGALHFIMYDQPAAFDAAVAAFLAAKG
jgi:pimeloyl-[acyl-carrier protein] methyl ester esterase